MVHAKMFTTKFSKHVNNGHYNNLIEIHLCMVTHSAEPDII